MPEQICCPKCGKVCGEWKSDHISISKIDLLVYGAEAMPRTCPKCGHIFDMLEPINDKKNIKA